MIQCLLGYFRQSSTCRCRVFTAWQSFLYDVVLQAQTCYVKKKKKANLFSLFTSVYFTYSVIHFCGFCFYIIFMMEGARSWPDCWHLDFVCLQNIHTRWFSAVVFPVSIPVFSGDELTFMGGLHLLGLSWFAKALKAHDCSSLWLTEN